MTKNNEQSKEEIMKSIEIKTANIITSSIEKGLIQSPLSLINNNNDVDKDKIEDSSKFLIELMKSGAEEFKNKIGREMTYSEMRQMFG